MDKIDFRNVIVNKPWGYEYLMYQSALVGIWCLYIKHGAQTSLHCHPTKKSGLILLEGRARVSFLNDHVNLRPAAKMMIRPGLFHRTSAISADGISVIEVETPADHSEVVRLDDEYDRELSPYEGLEAMVPMDERCLRLPEPAAGERLTYDFHGCVLSVEVVKNHDDLTARRPGEIIVVLEGGLFTTAGEPVLSHGDVVDTDTLVRLADSFDAPEGISMLTIRRAE